MLVDDWENVTKNNQLVPLPHVHPVDEILNDYLASERPHREDGSASLEILEETVSGLRNYFDRCLGRILLYRYLCINRFTLVWEADIVTTDSSATSITICINSGLRDPIARTRALSTHTVQSIWLVFSVNSLGSPSLPIIY